MANRQAQKDRLRAERLERAAADLPPALGLIESRDGGKTWRSLSLQGEADFHVLPAAFAADGKGNLYFARPDGSVDASADGGQTWVPRSRN